MLAYVLAACKTSDPISFEKWCESCHIEIQSTAEDAGVEIGSEAGKPKAEYISPLSEIADRRGMDPQFHVSQSEMSEEDIINHNEAALKVLDSWPSEIIEKPEEPNNDAAVKHASADRSGV